MADSEMADQPAQPWAPPGIARPWPRDEYLHDGGDRRVPARVQPDWQIRGLDTEDTIAHFDTLDGRTLVEASNRVHIYAPRFGAVRKVVGVDGFEIKEGLVRYDVPLEVQVDDKVLEPATTAQHVQAGKQENAKRVRNRQRNQPGLVAANNHGLLGLENREKLLYHRRDQNDDTFHYAAEPLLAMRIQDAIHWTADQGVQVVLDDRMAVLASGNAKAQATYAIHHEGTPRLKIVKTASTDFAEPGTLVEFILEFQNVGTEPIGNVTIVDNLTTRLEYVSHSQRCSRKADFLTEPNEGDSLVLRWEIVDPLPVGQGGTIQFQCRVR
ncbi:MAG: DUF11 domain-containing protein [Planctomycetales bacterium]|nr:DUF11 domain-containing protein [Planctomycetales bacterium]NIM08695.1 DUF11 domain-containing protein [Planctomycetales bacterium]NIN08165.1 DUF11 domain-containing protein [Planctomycetales bacterium]NIN77292.1 DUF11 domain-containing protein [Planctomycetales bacterium]NIO34480.1 DUF11 domain-containing protein [Planctomycetales bacterium]